MSSARGYFLGVGWGGKSKTPLEWENIPSCEERCLTIKHPLIISFLRENLPRRNLHKDSCPNDH